MLLYSKYTRFIVENWDNIWNNLMHSKKDVLELQVRQFKNCNKWAPAYRRLLKMKKFIFWINAQTPINQDWNTPTHLKSNGPHVKAPLIFWILIMTFNLCFHHQLCVKWVCIHIGNNSGHVGQTHSRFPKCLWMFPEMHIKLASLIISLTNDNLSIIICTVYSTYNNFMYLNRNFHLLEI